MFDKLRPDVPLFQLIYKLVNTVVAGVLWVLCCIPVVTAGAATTALYYTIVKTVRHGRGTVFSTFFRAFRDNFKTATAATVMMLAYCAVSCLGVMIAAQLTQATGTVAFAPYLAGTAFLPWALVLPYLFPVLSRFDYKVGGLFLNAFTLSIRHFASTLLFWVLLTGGVLLTIQYPQYALAVPGVICLLISVQMEKIFRKYYLTALNLQPGDEVPWYLE